MVSKNMLGHTERPPRIPTNINGQLQFRYSSIPLAVTCTMRREHVSSKYSAYLS